MSFSGTPLGQARRLDRDTFLGKAHTNGNRPPSPRRTALQPSFSLAATTTDARSAAVKHTFSVDGHQPADTEPALARFARQKQREASQSRPTGLTAPNPTRWSVKDTSVNIAGAFNQAANGPPPDMASTYSSNPTNQWASGSRPPSHVPRSTSVEYEAQTSNTLNKRLAPPPARGGRGSLKPPSAKSRSMQSVPDSEGEEVGPSGRGKSPFGQIVDAARNALKPAEFFLRQKSQEPENMSGSFDTSANGSGPGNDSSYSYGAEESLIQRQQRERGRGVKKGRISVDNQAWKPSLSDFEESEEEDDGQEKRGKRKKVTAATRLTNLPSVADGKQTKKRRPKGRRGDASGVGGDEDSGAQTDDTGDVSATNIAAHSSNPPPPSQKPRSTRISVEPQQQQQQQHTFEDASLDNAEEGLQSIPEVPEEDIRPASRAASAVPDKPVRTRVRRNSRATTPSRTPPRFSVGALLGTILRYIIGLAKNVLGFFVQLLSSMFFLLGRVLGTIYDILINRPVQWVSGPQSGVILSLGKYLLLGATILSAWYLLPVLTSRLPSLPGRGSPAPVYTPGAPVGNIDELVQRLARIESALSDLSLDTTRLKVKTEDSTKSYGDIVHRLGSVEGRITAEARRITDTESREREALGKNVNSVKKEVETIYAQLETQQKILEKERAAQRQREEERERKAKAEREALARELEEKQRVALERAQREQEKHQQRPGPPVSGNDSEARKSLKALEERLGGVEGAAKEALDIGKKLASAPAVPAVSQGSAWWNKIVASTGNRGLKITTNDGQDVTGLISTLVEDRVMLLNKDTIAKVDYASYYAGGRILPSYTSESISMKPESWVDSWAGWAKGQQYPAPNPPVYAIEPGLELGRCWPMKGSRGHLGIHLPVHVRVEEVTVDSVPKELAYDLRGVPREVEVWAHVEGRDNLEKLALLRQRQVEDRRKELEAKGEQLGENWDQEELERIKGGAPETLPRGVEYLRLAKFEFDLRSKQHIQTFPVEKLVKESGIDVGIVVFAFMSNYGQDGYTCVYRVRVHGEFAGELPGVVYPVEQEGDKEV